MKPISENKIKYLAIEQLDFLGWEFVHGSVISPKGEKPERENYEQTILTKQLPQSVLTSIHSHTQLRDTLLPKLMVEW